MESSERVQGPARVAIVEGQRLLAGALEELVRTAGFDVVGCFSNGDSLLGRIQEVRPEVVILDLRLTEEERPGREGMGLLRELHRRHPELRLLVYAESAGPDGLERAYQEGAAGYLDKQTAGAQEVADGVRAVLRGERVFPVGMLDVAFSPHPRPSEPALLQSISPREREVLSYIAAGADNLRIAVTLRISERTVKAHVTNLYRKLGSGNRIQLALDARQLGVRPSA